MSYALKYKELRKNAGLSQEEFAIISGTSRSVISQIEIGKLKPSLENIAMLAKNLKIPYSYFFEEDVKVNDKKAFNGKMPLPLKEQFDKYDEVQDEIKGLHFRITGSRRENIILVPVKARAGYLAGYGDQEWIEKLESFSIPGCTNGNYRMFELEGQSMYPTLSDGDYVVGRREPDCFNIKEGAIYIIVSRIEGIIIKRVLNAQKTTGKLHLVSDNTSYNPIDMDCAAIAEMWEFYMLLTTLPGEKDPEAARLRFLEREVADIKRLLLKR